MRVETVDNREQTHNVSHSEPIGTRLAKYRAHDLTGIRFERGAPRTREGIMSLVRLLGFTTLTCGCVVGRYREVATSREVTYVEEKGKTCGSHGHRRNHTVAVDRLLSPVALNRAS
jgi:hypothetical protein